MTKRQSKKATTETSELVRDGLADAAIMSRDQIQGLKAWSAGEKHPVDVKRVLDVDQTHLLLTHVRILTALSEEERKQIAASIGKFAGITDPEVVSEYEREAKKFLASK